MAIHRIRVALLCVMLLALPSLGRTPPAEAQASCPTGQMHATYYAGRTLSGTPLLARCEAAVNATKALDYYVADIGGAAVPDDDFSARWVGRFAFPTTGTYTVTVRSDDGSRVWIDGALIHDRWFAQGATQYPHDVDLAAGEHELRVEYYEGTGGATIGVWWALKAAATPTVTATNTATPMPTNTATPTATDTPTPVPPTSTPVPPTPAPPPSNPGTAGVLLDNYYHLYRDAERGVYAQTIYRPRQLAAGLQVADASWGTFTVSNPGPYAGWDLLTTANRDSFRTAADADWLTLKLRRSATVGLVWRGPGSAPGWLASQGYAASPPIVTSGGGGNQAGSWSVWTKTVGPGELVVPAARYQLGGSGNTWWVLLAESYGAGNGIPSAAPAVPAGKEAPVPNATCPAWVHDQYMTVGPDGRAYRTWHRPIDPVYWCYIGHEHGDDPSLIHPDYKPTYGLAATADGASEFHEGHKTLSFVDTQTGAKFAVSTHFGTSNVNSICSRHHEMSVGVAVGNELVADVTFQADFGVAVQNNTNDVPYPMSHPQCPGGVPAPGSTGHRQMPVTTSDVAGPSPNPVFYEPWRADMRAVRATLGVYLSDWNINNPDPATICRDRDCTTAEGGVDLVATGKPGAQRFAIFQPDAEVRAPAHAGAQGYFYTDPRATRVVNAGDPGAVRQFVKPGLVLPMMDLQNTMECAAQYPMGDRWSTCPLGSNHGVVRNPEGSLKLPN